MSFARSLFTVSSLTILSRIGGFIRDSLTAIFLGAGATADAFFVAQRLPNLFRSLFAEGAFSAAFVPLYTTEHERHGEQAAQYFAGQAMMVLLAVLIPFSIVVMMLMPQVILILAPGFERDPEKYKLAVDFSTITFPYLALISITALQTGVLNARGRFGPGAAAPIAFNIVLVSGLFAARFFGWQIGYTLAWAVTISGAVQCAWLAISCYRARASIPFMRPHLGDASRRLFRNIGPGAVGAGAAQINLLVSTILASTLPTGSISYLFYADRLNQLPLGIVGIAVATTLLPLLSRHIEAGAEDKVRHYNSRAIEFSLILGLPATIGLAFAAQPIIQTLFQHGAFTHEDTVATAQTLCAYAFGIPAFLLVKVFAAGFFARHDTKTPVQTALTAIAVNIVVSITLVGLFKYIGIAMATCIATWVNASLLYRQLRCRKIVIGDEQLPQRIKKIVFCAAIMAVVTGFLTNIVWDGLVMPNVAQEILCLSGLIGLSGLSYAVALQVTGAMRWGDLVAIIRKKTL